jgi:alkylhydroperoxidase/carboxymuconolactone decarboxylase family protein YurZ
MGDKGLLARGWAIRKRLWPDSERGGVEVFKALDPEYAEFVVEHAYGGTYGDPTLDLRTRSLLTCALLTAAGRTRLLDRHLRGALNIGIAPAELVAVFKQTALYAGMPAANDAFKLLKEILDERKPAV